MACAGNLWMLLDPALLIDEEAAARSVFLHLHVGWKLACLDSAALDTQIYITLTFIFDNCNVVYMWLPEGYHLAAGDVRSPDFGVPSLPLVSYWWGKPVSKQDVVCDVPDTMMSHGSDVIASQTPHGNMLAFGGEIVFYHRVSLKGWSVMSNSSDVMMLLPGDVIMLGILCAWE